MPQTTKKYNLEYFRGGSYWSASSEHNRFWTLDYNLDSYVGVVGVGIIDGWTVETVSGLIVQILPGEGIVNGYYAESPYTVKQRSDMAAGDREVEVINEDHTTEGDLTVVQRATYVSVVQLYDPTFNPVGDIENSYVKVVVPTQITVSNNADTYIYAQFPTGRKPYPPLTTPPRPPVPGPQPVRSSYTTYDLYKTAKDAWDAQVTALNDYKWYDDVINHFTAVEFVSSTSLTINSRKIILARVTARSGQITSIDTSMANSLANMESTITKFAREYIVGHVHGGSKSYDPPKIRLETDIRSTVLSKYETNTDKATFNVVEIDYTSITLGHKHTYRVDANGDGITIDQLGSTNSHFHIVTGYVVGNPQGNSSSVDSHIHTVKTQTEKADTWDADSQFVVYVNDVAYADETSTNVTVNPTSKNIIFNGGINVAYNKYRSSFPVSFVDATGTFEETYTFESKAYSVYYFMLSMINDFNTRYSRFFSIQEEDIGTEIVAGSGYTSIGNFGTIQTNLSQNNPFIFFSSDGTGITGITDLQNQSCSAQALLKVVGDRFVFTPDAANNIEVSLVEKGDVDTVKIEILSNTEVTGVLKSENVIYLNANKILTGEFIPEVIPFISHAGRLKEECLPFQYAMTSKDGIRYNVVLDVDSSGLLSWLNDSENNTTSSVHTHEIISPIVGDNKAVYSIKEDAYGNLYVGTSDGLRIVPSDPAYEFVVNGVELYFYGTDLWDLLGKAKFQYEKETGNPLVITEDLYGTDIEEAATELVNDGDSVLMTGTPYPNRQSDTIMIKKISEFKMPDFGYTREVEDYDIQSDEVVLSQRVDTDANGASVTYYTVERDFNNTPIWSIELETATVAGESYITSYTNIDIVAIGSDVAARSSGLNRTTYQSWDLLDAPFFVGISRKVIKDYQGYYWISTNNGLMISRSYYGETVTTFSDLPGGNPNINDVIEGEIGSIYSVSGSGAFKTTDEGKTWTSVYDVRGGFTQILRDKTLDRSDVVSGHYHLYDVNSDGNGFLAESIGSGTAHVHEVIDWQVQTTLGHSHTLIVTLYLVDSNKVVWKSLDNGLTWEQYVDLPSGDCGDCFAAFGYLFVGKSDGLYRSNGGAWSIVLAKCPYSYQWNNDVTGFFIGGDNVIYRTYDGTSFELVYEFVGLPLAILVENESKKYFGYAYSNQSQTFHFKDFTLSSNEMTALVDTDKWYATGGGWGDTDAYDVYINYKKTLSTKVTLDRRDTYGYDFSIDTQEGIIDFSAVTSLAENISVYDDSIDVVDGSDFSVGDRIVVYSNEDRMYSVITAINQNNFTLDSRSTKTITTPAVVEKIVALNASSSVIVSVYNSLLSNIGTMTHDEIEDGLSYFSDGRPYKFNDTYLSNLLQLTQAIRYVYPDINSEFINNLFYDFRYVLVPTSDPLYIGNFIDTVTSDVYNQKSYDSNFVGKDAKSINKILIGYGGFDGTIIVGTDIGIFWAKMTPSLEANWFYIDEIQYPVYDLAIYGNDKLIAATGGGTYWTADMITWFKEESASMDFIPYSIGLRWPAEDTYVSTSPHSTEFVSDQVNNRGIISADSGTPYTIFAANNWIKIEGAGDKDGSYSIVDIRDVGPGFGSQLIVTPAFSGPDGTKGSAVMTMSVWWGRWDGDTNTSDSNITNTLLVGGENHISYNDGGETWIWRESSFDFDDFVARKFTALTNGRILLAATGTDPEEMKNYLLNSDDIGKTWRIFREFDEVKGDVVSSQLTSFDNTVLTVTYTTPSDYIYVDGILDQLDISVFAGNSTIAVFSGSIVWNEKNVTDKIIVFGNTLNSLIRSDMNYRFVVSPSKINTLAEDQNGTVYYGTDRGMYYDLGTTTSTYYPTGVIATPGYNGTVSKIDISGDIISLVANDDKGTTVLTVTADTPLRGNDLVGKQFYITDTVNVDGYKIVSNSSISAGNESSITLETVLSQSYVGKRFRVSGDSSRVYINYSLPVTNNQFNGGKLYVTSNDKYDNNGKFYTIKNSTTEYLDLNVSLMPTSTLVTRIGSTSSTQTFDLQVGQQVRLVDSTGLFTMWASLDREFNENALVGLSLHVTNNTSAEDKTYVVNSNFKNGITLDSENVMLFAAGDQFELKGSLFEQLPSFSHVKTSVESGHYHLTNTVGGIVSGEIGTFGAINSSYVTINVTNTENFNTAVVQAQGDLFENAEIIFTNPSSPNLRYTSSVMEHTPTTITVRLKATGYWNFTQSDLTKVSVGWSWEIDGTSYGYTEGTYYDDFTAIWLGLTATASVLSDQVKVESTVGLLAGDKVRIQDDTLSYEINYISSIVDGTTVELENALGRTFFKTKNPQMKVLRDVFTNTHIHQIRDNELEPISVSDYLVRGYPSQHSHRVLPLMTDVSTLLTQNNEVISVGSGSIIYKTSDGDSWREVIDLNDFLEGSDEVGGSSTATLYTGGIMAGSTTGNIFAQVSEKGTIINLEKPI